ncbi:glycoside hydrolase family 115 protein [Annulohypoxylon maeteangense]|uniref:glycoside hydrolase family 115 protein n=1 Tax=Annulohypoxylon maeteangense TaxID=1927788 RepID=UPI0020085E8F|nr:glycoside hydrolase family 115 protein [Annulohypoxylon maeteangense]KAI0880051.1 glycoside hydrolase family 115 protein [Annulohypoxylon maeteangense]
MRLSLFRCQFLAAVTGFAPFVVALGQQQIIGFANSDGAFQIAGGSIAQPQILVSSNDYWGVIRAAGDLTKDFGRVTGTNFTLSNGEAGAEPAVYEYKPITRNYTHYEVNNTQVFHGPAYTNPSAENTVIIVGTLGHSKVIDDLVAAGKLNTSDIEGKWESFTTSIVQDPIAGCSKAVIIVGSDPRGTIFGIYDISEQIGVSPWYWWADVPIKQSKDIYVLPDGKVQGPPSVKYRGFFINDEQPGLSGWVGWNYPDTPYGVGYNADFYSNVFELLLRLRANYLWPALWATMFEVDDPTSQPLADAWEIVLGSSHTEPMMRAQNEFGTFYIDEGLGPWAYNLNNKTIDEYFVYGAQRAKPYARNSLWTMGMRGTGDTAIEGLGVEFIVSMLEALVHNQRAIIEDVLDVKIEEAPQLWCLYKEVMSYIQQGLTIPEDITLLWADDNWGNVRRVPIGNETTRSGGAGVYYHFDYVGDTRNYKWINTVQLEKTAEQMQLAYAHGADRIWIVNVGDLKPLEIPLTHFLDMAYDINKWGVDDVSNWTLAWATREFGPEYASSITEIMTRFGMFAARRKFELVEPYVYSTINYNEGDAVLGQWQGLAQDAQAIYDQLDEAHQPAFFEMILHPILGGQIIHQVHIGAARNMVYANQHRNAANEMISSVLASFDADAELTIRWDSLLDGKWKHMLDQTHFGYDGYWQQPMRNVLPAMAYVQTAISSIAGSVGIAVEGSNASIPGDDKYHANSGNTLVLPSLDPYGPVIRWFDVFSRGKVNCDWKAETDLPWVKLSQYNGTVGPDNGTDSRVFVSVDWANAPQIVNNTVANINFSTGCGRQGFSNWYGRPIVQLPINLRTVPSNFSLGFVESDKHVAIEGPHYQRIHTPSNVPADSGITYKTLKNYGRTLGGVTLWPQSTSPQTPETAPALEYDLYLFTNISKANVTLHLSPTQNYLSDETPLEFAVSLFPAGAEQAEPQVVQFVGDSVGVDMPPGWGRAVADVIWGLAPIHNTTTTWNIAQEGAYTLRIWGLAPSVIVQKVIVDLGGVRPSYLGPPENFFLGRDEIGVYNQTSFADAYRYVG